MAKENVTMTIFKNGVKMKLTNRRIDLVKQEPNHNMVILTRLLDKEEEHDGVSATSEIFESHGKRILETKMLFSNAAAESLYIALGKYLDNIKD